jgi:predicted MFS family arabinose efflux permease
VALVGGLVVLVYALSGAASHGWGSAWTVGLLGLAACLLGAFAVIERRVAEPLIPPSVWRVPGLAPGAGLMLGVTGILVGTFFLVSIYLQGILGWSALRSGLGLLPFVATTALGVAATSHVIARVGSRVLILAGLVLSAASLLWLSAAPTDAHYAPDLLPGLVLLGLGMGLAVPAVSITMMDRVGPETAGAASGVLSTAHEIGAALGTAVFSAVAVSSSTGAIGSSGSAFVAGAIVAAGLAVLAVAAVPAVRPAAGTAMGAH